MAEETPTAIAPSADDKMEAELTALMTPQEPVVEPAAEVTTPTLGEEPKPATETPAEETLETKLAAIPDEVTPPVETPKLTSDQEQILAVIPDVRTAQQITTLATGYQNFSNAFESGDFARVEQMFEAWNPQAYDTFKEHLYQKHVASGEWVDRWIADKEGNPSVNQGMKRLEQQIGQLQAKLSQRDQQETTQQHSQRLAQIGQAYENHIKKWFDHLDFPPADREIVKDMVDARVGRNREVRDAVANGRLDAVNPIFKAAVAAHLKLDMARNDKRETTIAAQDKKKPLLTGGTITPTTGVTDEMVKGAKGAEKERLADAKLDQDLQALFGSKKKR